MTIHHIGTAIGGFFIILDNWEGSACFGGLIMAESSNFWYLLRQILDFWNKKSTLAYKIFEGIFAALYIPTR